MLGADFKPVDLREVSGGGLTGAVESSKPLGLGRARRSGRVGRKTEKDSVGSRKSE